MRSLDAKILSRICNSVILCDFIDLKLCRRATILLKRSATVNEHQCRHKNYDRRPIRMFSYKLELMHLLKRVYLSLVPCAFPNRVFANRKTTNKEYPVL